VQRPAPGHNDGANWHQSIAREMVTRSEAFPRWQSLTIALGQSTEDAMSGAAPMMTMYVNEHRNPQRRGRHRYESAEGDDQPEGNSPRSAVCTFVLLMRCVTV
jgi:hypothetical protein